MLFPSNGRRTWPNGRSTAANKIQQNRTEEKMPERYRVMPLWAWVLGALLVIGLIVAAALAVRVQYDLGDVQAKLEQAENEASQAAARVAEFSKRADELKSELEATKTERQGVQTNLDQAGSEIAQLKSTLSSAQSEVQDKQARIEAVQNELTGAKRASDEAKAESAKAKEQSNAIQAQLDQASAEIETLKGELADTKQTSHAAKAESVKAREQSNAIQARLNEANAEVERLKGELEQTKAALPSTVAEAPVEQPTEVESTTVHREITPDQIVWGPIPPGLPEGAQSVVLAGDQRSSQSLVCRKFRSHARRYKTLCLV
jgi:DNA repair exonuclease SbcCD ATPase subunit